MWLSRGSNLIHRPDRAPSLASLDDPLVTLKHLAGQDNVKALRVIAYVRKATLSHGWYTQRDSLLAGQVLLPMRLAGVGYHHPAGTYGDLETDPKPGG